MARLRVPAVPPGVADAPEKSYDPKVNHPLSIGDTDVFLIGHGYAPGHHDHRRQGNTWRPDCLLLVNQSFQSIGVSRR